MNEFDQSAETAQSAQAPEFNLDKVSEGLNDAFAKAEAYIRANPVPVAIGVATAGALVALALSGRKTNHSGRRWQKDLGDYADRINDTVRSEIRNLKMNDNVDKISRMLANTDVSKMVEPFSHKIVEALMSAKSTVSDTVNTLAKR